MCQIQKKITINFDDSIIESNATKREQDRLDVQMGAMSLEEYRMKWYSEDEQTAKSKISNINTRINTDIESLPGMSNKIK